MVSMTCIRWNGPEPGTALVSTVQKKSPGLRLYIQTWATAFISKNQYQRVLHTDMIAGSAENQHQR